MNSSSPPKRHAVGQPAGTHIGRPGQLREHVRSGFAFHGRIGGHDHLLDLALGKSCGEQIETEFLRPESIQWRKPTEQHKIVAAIAGGLLDGELVDRRLDDAQQVLVARCIGAERTDFLLAETAAAPTVADLFDCQGQPLGQSSGAGPITLENMERHALRGLRADPGQTAQGLDQIGQQGRTGTQNGILNPAGRLRPAASPPRRSWLSAPTLLTASLIAAATRSSAISGVIGEQLAVDIDPTHFVTAAHDHADQTTAGLAGDLELGEFFLRALHVFLHALGLLHQTG